MTPLDNSWYRTGQGFCANKRGSGAGDIVEMIPVLVVVSIVAVVVFGFSTSHYDYDISIRDSEARLLGVLVEKCLVEEGVLNLDDVGEEIEEGVLFYCGVLGGERIYVGVEVEWETEDDGLQLMKFSEGDSGSLWIRDLFERVAVTGNVASGLNNENVEKIAKYNPGYYDFEHPVLVVSEGDDFDGKLRVEVLVNYE